MDGLELADPDYKNAILEKHNLAKQRLEVLSKGTSKGSVAVILNKKAAKIQWHRGHNSMVQRL